ncbi:MAG: flagellar basal body rod protein FlgB [Pseudomonadota bacterium]
MDINPFAKHAEALKLRGYRNEVLATNIANADTPGYKARDFDFGAALAGARMDGIPLARTDAQHLTPTGGQSLSTRDALAYRVPYQPSLDGNTVESDIEQAAYAENVVGYQASLNFLNQKIRGIRGAIKGEI